MLAQRSWWDEFGLISGEWIAGWVGGWVCTVWGWGRGFAGVEFRYVVGRGGFQGKCRLDDAVGMCGLARFNFRDHTTIGRTAGDCVWSAWG